MKEQDEIKRIRREQLHGEVMKGIDQIRTGQGVIYESGDNVAEEIISRGKARKGRKSAKK